MYHRALVVLLSAAALVFYRVLGQLVALVLMSVCALLCSGVCSLGRYHKVLWDSVRDVHFYHFFPPDIKCSRLFSFMCLPPYLPVFKYLLFLLYLFLINAPVSPFSLNWHNWLPATFSSSHAWLKQNIA